jgi:p-cumate 2,3-dioxygenase subunit alpha
MNAPPTAPITAIKREWYTNHDLFAREMEAVFSQTWQYVGHESELRKVGSFKTIVVGEQPLLIVKGDDEQIRAFGNTCVHRAAIVEDRPRGATRQFQCLYHHWQYDTRGRLARVPLPNAHSPAITSGELSLPEVKLAHFSDALFVNLGTAESSLETYFETCAPVFKKIMQPGVHGRWEFLTEHQYEIQANWKLFVENTIDGYHANFLHAQSLLDAGSGPLGLGRSADLDGHGFIEWANNEEDLGKGLTQLHLSVFPNLLVLYHGANDILAIRHVLPLSTTQTIIRVYAFTRADYSEDERATLLGRFNYWWGPGGRNGADDMKALESTQRGLNFKGGPLVRVDRGVKSHKTGDYNDEHAIRSFWMRWRQCMGFNVK